jgi:hypothetical protein
VLDKIRVQMELPSKGFVWLFINQNVSISQFAELCKAEDPKIENVSVIDGSASVEPNSNLYSLLSDSKKNLRLKLNSTEYEFNNRAKREIVVPIESNKWHTTT